MNRKRMLLVVLLMGSICGGIWLFKLLTIENLKLVDLTSPSMLGLFLSAFGLILFSVSEIRKYNKSIERSDQR